MKVLYILPALGLLLLAACSPGETGDRPAEAGAASEESEEVSVDEAADHEDDTSGDYEMGEEDAAATEAEAAAPDGSCLAELGEEAAQTLVDQCINISPATRPPCNALNSCDMIRGEIARGCGFGDTSDNPDYCADYE